MRVSLEFLRGLVGALGLIFAYFLGRTTVALYRGKVRPSRMYTWLLRTVVALLAVCYFGLDRKAIVVLMLAAVAAALGAWTQARPQKEEDLTRTIFPEEK